MEEITDDRLKEFWQWCKKTHGTLTPSAMITCLCGYFHTYTAEAKRLFKRINTLNKCLLKGQ